MNNFAVGTALLLAITMVVDAAGNPASFKNPPTWSTSDETILSLTADADGLSAKGTVQKTGNVTVLATGDGVTESVSIDVVAGQVVSFQITVTAA